MRGRLTVLTILALGVLALLLLFTLAPAATPLGGPAAAVTGR